METTPTKTIMNASMAIDAHCEAIGADSMVANLAKCFFQEIVGYRGHEDLSIQALVAVCVVYACKQVAFTQTAESILSFTDIPADYLICAMKAVGDFLGMSTEEDRRKREREEWAEAEGVRRDIYEQLALEELRLRGQKPHIHGTPGYQNIGAPKYIKPSNGVIKRSVPAEASHFHEDMEQYFIKGVKKIKPGRPLLNADPPRIIWTAIHDC